MARSKVSIFCINCLKPSGHFEDDLIRKGVKKPVKCKNCGEVIADVPNIGKDNINLNSSK